MPDRRAVPVLLKRNGRADPLRGAPSGRLVKILQDDEVDLMPPLTRIAVDRVLVADRLQRFAQQREPLFLHVNDSTPARFDLSAGGPAHVHEKYNRHISFSLLAADIDSIGRLHPSSQIRRSPDQCIEVKFLAIRQAVNAAQALRPETLKIPTEQPHRRSLLSQCGFNEVAGTLWGNPLRHSTPTGPVVLNHTIPFVI